MFKKSLVSAALLPALFIGCAADDTSNPDTIDVAQDSFVKGGDGKADASAVAVFVNMDFSGELLTTSSFSPERQIEDQLLYTIGHLNEDNSVGRLDKLVLDNVTTERVDGKVKINYDARLLVAWGKKNNVPTEYEFTLPHDVSFQALEDFTEKYSHDCVDFGAHDVTSGSMWYYYRPGSFRCEIDDADVIKATAKVSLSETNTTGKYPEYHRIWEDDALNVVAIFGKYEDGATTTSDAGIRAYNSFVNTMKSDLGQFELETVPAEFPSSPGVENPDVTFRAMMEDGTTVEVVALLVDNVRTAGFEFDQRYESLTGKADLIAYNGHAGLGANIRAMARKGQWEPGQYSIVFMDGCDTYAYVDSALNDAFAAINPDDPNGTKHLDIITNAMPAFFHEVSNNTVQLIRGLMSKDDPQTFEQMFERIDRSQVILVSGEEDNEFVPGMDDGGDVDEEWKGMTEEGTVAQDEEHRFETTRLPAGVYTFNLSGNGDADLYVRVGNEPTESTYDCRPFRWGSDESCTVELAGPTVVHVMVRGWDRSSDYALEGAGE